MGLFKKKADPITERARTLNDQIASLEKEIARLADKLESEPPEPPPSPAPPPPAPPPKPARNASAEPQPGMPRLRSTAFPQSQVVMHSQAEEPVFEDVVPHNPFKANGKEPEPEPEPDIGVRKGNVSEMWKRIQSQFRTPPASNAKLVSYLAAGSVQGLRPLRYEKRIARNRAIVLIVFLGLVIWGLLAWFLNR